MALTSYTCLETLPSSLPCTNPNFPQFHCVPNIVHYGGSKTPGKMEAGQVFTIEPMINAGVASLDHWKDDWTAVTKDGKKSAQFEETIL